ncbi:MAG: hypothetical protein ACXWDO_07910 [Bacteroidia bacterium]
MAKLIMKILLIFFLLINGAFGTVSARDSIKDSSKNTYLRPYSFYINNPIGLISKVRGKFEYRLNQNNSLLLSLCYFYQITPGVQSYIEYRNYFSEKNNVELFGYGKLGAGKTFASGGYYGLAGAGFGQQISVGKSRSFLIQFSQGLKYCPALKGDIEAEPSSGTRGLFYLIGPGAVVDLNLNFGWRF